MKKYIRTTFESGEVYDIPLEVIAKNRTDYYEGRAKEKGEDDFNYKEEYDYVMEDDYEGIDWASNNMDWKDVGEYAVKVEEAKEVERDWCNAEKEIIDKEDKIK